jgi:thymidylate kinase
MTKILVFEGADSSGKTTLAKAIIERYPSTRYFHGLPYIGWVEEAHRAMLHAAMNYDNLVIIDRHWISEYVYGPIFRGKIAYSDDVAKEFDLMIRSFGMYILCVPSNVREHERRFQRERANKKEMFDSSVEVAMAYRHLAYGYMHEVGDNLLQRYIRHGDFTMRNCLIYDLDVNGRNMPDTIKRIGEYLNG